MAESGLLEPLPHHGVRFPRPGSVGKDRDSTTRGVYNVSASVTLPSVTTGPPHVLSNNTYTDDGPPSPTYPRMYSLPTVANSGPNYLCVLPPPRTLRSPSLLPQMNSIRTLSQHHPQPRQPNSDKPPTPHHASMTGS